MKFNWSKIKNKFMVSEAYMPDIRTTNNVRQMCL